ncbi:MAG TPA: DUF1553 domain-containing protein [Gemmataceae bacterium]|nr:DUF1553 domain-containing protein [Gemmataceae bacterium]
MLRSLYRFALVGLGFTLCLAAASAADLKILPASVTLTGPHASQRLLVLAEENGQIVGEQTPQAKLTSSHPAVATVDATGVVRAAGDGEATITAAVGGKQTTVKVTVRKTKAPFTWSFRNHVIPMLTRAGCNSGACHGALAGKGGLKLSLRGYDPDSDHFVLTRQALGRRIDRSEPARSLVLLKPTQAISHGGGQKIEPGSTDYHVLADWIAAGAPGPRAEEPRIQRLEVLPASAVLKPKDTLQIVVRAWYSDGHSEDVTRWAKLNSSEDLVATVNADGKAAVSGYGEAAITVWYSNLVAANRIASPLPNALDPKVFTSAEKHNFIDGLVLKKLESLRIPPSPSCSDGEFMRRAYLDAAGILPKPEELEKFLADKSPDKRAKLIDSLLERPEFVDYWAYKWSDLLLITTRRLPQPAVWSFYQFVRQSVADNKPWDRFARDILTASGGSLDNGAANYFVLHKDISDLTESTAVTFMGMSVTCCRCHNHPLEKWTQDQYWSMANLFARVALKNGERAGDVNVQALPSGDVPHLRRGVPMPPTPLDGKPLSLDSSIDRRVYFVDWLTAADNPYFAKALVNRVWRSFMGRGLVEAEDDLRQTNPPTNPELLNALAKDFIAHKFDVKHLMRTIMNSASYQRSSRPLPGNRNDDRFYSHYLIRRLSAEILLDAYSQVTEVPTPFTQISSAAGDSASKYNGYPLGTRALQLPDSLVVSRFLDAFGRPERSQTCSCERQQDSSVAQALHVNNGKTLNDKIRAKNSRIEKWLRDKITDEQAVQRLFLMALSREPTATEMKKFQTLLAEVSADAKTTRREALEDLFWSVLASKEFMFNR